MLQKVQNNSRLLFIHIQMSLSKVMGLMATLSKIMRQLGWFWHCRQSFHRCRGWSGVSPSCWGRSRESKIQDVEVSRLRVAFQKGQAVTNTAAVWRRRQHRRTFSVAVRSWRRNIRCVPFVTFINFIIIKVSYYLINIFIRNLLIFLAINERCQSNSLSGTE